MRLYLLLAVVSITAGCATFPSCSIGVAFLGPVPVPTASCDLVFEPEDEEEDD